MWNRTGPDRGGGTHSPLRIGPRRSCGPCPPGVRRRPPGPGDNALVTEPDQLRLLAVHAHPDDEASCCAATMAKYVAEGARVMVATCTLDPRGSVLNPAMDQPEVWERLPQIRIAGRRRARHRRDV